MANVGGRIRTLRAERTWTLDKLADEAGVSKSLLSKLENLADSNPSMDTLFKVAKAFKVTIADLLESDKVQAKRIIPDQKPSWVDAVADALRPDNRKPDEDVLQALYVLQARKGDALRSDMAWVHMYHSLEMNFKSARKS
jgi:XRE family transcriptional regulator of biofilm formation